MRAVADAPDTATGTGAHVPIAGGKPPLKPGPPIGGPPYGPPLPSIMGGAPMRPRGPPQPRGGGPLS